MQCFKRVAKRATLLLAIAAILLGPVAILLAPALETQAQSAPTPSGLNAPPFDVYNGFHNSPSSFQTCTARFTSTTVTEDVIERTIRPLAIGGGTRDSQPQTGINTAWLRAHMNQNVPIIEWVTAASRPDQIINGGHETAGGSDTCDNIPPMVPVSTNMWVGPQFFLSWLRNATRIGGYYLATFVAEEPGANTGGRFEYIDIAQQCSMNELYSRDRTDRPTRSEFINQCQRSQSSPRFVVQGAPSMHRDVTLDASWVDAATINLSRTTPLPPGVSGPVAPTNETYRMPEWREWVDEDDQRWSLYFLWDSSDRPGQTWNSGMAVDNPIRSTDNNSHPTGEGVNNCVPFIAVKQNINLSRAGSSAAPLNINPVDSNSFSNRVSALGGAEAIFYDYGSDCAYLGNSDGTGSRTISDPDGRSRVWFYRGSDPELITTVFPTGDGNEIPFTGLYSQIGAEANQTVRIYEGGLDCGAQARVSPDTFVDESGNQTGTPGLHSTMWEFFEPCDPRRSNGSVNNVLTLSGPAGEEGFDRLQLIGPGLDLPEGDVDRLRCAFSNPLVWIICPVISISSFLIEWLDSGINSMLTINAFDSEEGFGEEAVDAFRGAWSVFRTIALALIVVAALVMVIAQAAGIEILDAYTIRKVLPRLLLAAIGITLSWQLAMLAITISNDLGQGVRAIIYAPFGESIEATVGGGATFIVGLLATGAIVAFGLLAVLSFVLTGAIAVFIAFALLAFREVAIIALTIVAPVAIACAILPNTQKVWDMWRKTFVMLLAAFVIIMAFIAVGRVFAAVTITAGDDDATGNFWGALMQIIGILSYFAPYFMIPFVFKMAGGMMAAVGGFASQGIQRMNAPLAKWRSDRGKQHRRETIAGNTWLGRIPGVGGAYRRVGMASKGGLSVTERGRARYQSAQKALMLARADEALKQDNGRAAGNTDANEIAITSNSARDFVNTYAQRLIDGGLTREVANQKAQEALGTFESGYGLKMGTAAAKLTAYKAHAADKTAYTGYSEDDTPEKKVAKYKANLAKLYEHGAGLMNAGIIDAADAAAISKSNNTRGDLSSIGFGSSITAFSDIAQHMKNDPRATGTALFDGAAGRKGKTLEDLMEEALLGTNASTLVHGRHEQISAFAPLIQKRLKQAGSNVKTAENESEAQKTAKRQVAKYAALAANIADAASQGHMVSGEKIATMFSEPIQELGGKTIQQVVAAHRGDEDFQKYRREYTSPTEFAASGGAASTPAGGGPAPTQPPGAPTAPSP